MNDASLSTKAVAPSGVFEGSPKALIEACGLPEIGPGLVGLSVRIDATLRRPFVVVPGGIVVGPGVAADFAASAVALREGIELHALGGDHPTDVHRVLAHATATVYAATTLAVQRRSGVPDGLVDMTLAEQLLAGDVDPGAIGRDFIASLRERDHLAGMEAGDAQAVARALPFATPTEVLLTMGGDHRQRVDWSVGYNSYRLSPRPVPWTAQFGSCTASSPSPRAFRAAEDLRHRLIEAALEDRLAEALEDEAEAIRATVLGALGVAAGVEVVLCPSGTDAELVALAMARRPGPMRSIVVAPLEIGGGSLAAAGGSHFSPSTPLGGPVEPGAPLDGFDVTEVDVQTIDVRRDDGGLRDPGAVEADIDAALADWDGPVLLHVVEGSKTGIRLPRAEAVEQWQARLGERLVVVVDAAQMRIDQHTVASHVAAGRLVFVTGSKFFGGPPFSGALLVPASQASRAGRRDGWPSGLGAYLSRFDVPASLPGLRAAASPDPNPGLLVRWAAAGAEMRSFLNASPEIRDEVLRALAAGIREILDDESEVTSIVDSPYTDIPSPDLRGLDDLPTIFTFLVLTPDGRPLDLDSTRLIHRLLAEDVADELGVDGVDRSLAQQRFHLGQPVPLELKGGLAGGLRIAVGAPTLSQIVFDHTRGRTWVDRVERELRDVRAAVKKVALLARGVRTLHVRA